MELDEFLAKEVVDAGYGGVEIQKSPVGTRITLYITRPGLVIGRKGMGIRDLTTKLETQFGVSNPQISVLEVEIPELNPRIMATRAASQITRGWVLSVPFPQRFLFASQPKIMGKALGS